MTKKHNEDLAKALAKIQPDDWDKALEMLAIGKLAEGDTYFGEHFSVEDALQMGQNIKNDFPIFNQTELSKVLEKGNQARELQENNEALRDRLDEALAVNIAFQKAAAEFRERMARALVQIQNLLEDSDVDFAEGALKEFSTTEIVTAKAAAGVALTDEEVAFLKENLAK